VKRARGRRGRTTLGTIFEGNPAMLTPAENTLLDHILAGHTTPAIAQHLCVSEVIVNGRLQRFFRKIKVENRTQAVIWALANQPELDTPCGYV
jgi:DNA-binding NarL/FixJ family response regulator